MCEKELKSLGQQLAYVYSVNKKMDNPLNLMFTGVGEKLKQLLDKSNAQNWAVQIFHKQTYLDVVQDKSKLVYLTADSPNLIQELDSEKAYIIGGIVDHNRHKLLTYTKATEQGIAHARLPIGENVQLCSSAVLTVNIVFEIIAKFLTINDWKSTLDQCIPDRKKKLDPTSDAKDGQQLQSNEESKQEGSSDKEEEEEKVNGESKQ